jgi:hypothetical protein
MIVDERANLGKCPAHPHHSRLRMVAVFDGARGRASASTVVHAQAGADRGPLHAGTNNISRGHTPDNVGAGLSHLIDQIRTARLAAHIFVAAIIQSNVPAEQARGRAFNALVPGIVASKGNRVYVVDQSTVGGADLYDTHRPNDYVYTKMAFNWYNAIRAHITGAENWPALSNPYTVRTSGPVPMELHDQVPSVPQLPAHDGSRPHPVDPHPLATQINAGTRLWAVLGRCHRLGARPRTVAGRPACCLGT